MKTHLFGLLTFCALCGACDGSASSEGTGANSQTGGSGGESTSQGGSSTHQGGATTGQGGETASGGATSTGQGGASTTGQGGASTTGQGGGSTASGGAGGNATVIPINNPSFEADFVPNGQFNSNIVPAGWKEYDPQNIMGLDYNTVGVLNPTGTVLYPAGAPDGSNVAITFLWRDQTNGIAAGLFQQLTHTLLPNSEYTLSVMVGNIAPEVAPYDLSGFPGYRVELVAGTQILAVDNNTLAPADGTFVQTTLTVATGSTDAALGLPVSIRLINLNTANSGIEVNFDEVSLTVAPVP